MIPSAALSAWLADPQAQRRSLDAVEACALDWSRHPLMTGLRGELDRMKAPTPQEVLAAARRFLDQSDDIVAMLRAMIAQSRADPFFRPPFHPLSGDIHNGMLLFHHPHLSIAAGVTGLDMLAAKKAGASGSTSVGFSGQLSLHRYVKAGGATVSFWECPPIDENFVASEAGPCRITGRRRIEDGEELVIDGRSQSFIIEHATGEMVYFQAVIGAGAAPLAAEYDSRTMAFIGASSTDEASSRVQMMASLLRTMERGDALPLMAEALASPQFYTRWHVMREMLALDAEAALPSLRRMAKSDPHPEVRGAARQTLRLFFEDEPCPA